MKISDLVKQLSEISAEHGDLRVLVEQDVGYGDIHGINVMKESPRTWRCDPPIKETTVVIE